MSERVRIPKDRLPPEIWQWLLEKVGVGKDDGRPFVVLMVESETNRELASRYCAYFEREKPL